jgi:hypothetical protein
VLAFDQFAVAILLLILVGGGMRLLYGAWPWEARKTWYCTRQAVDYVEQLRSEYKRDPALRRVRDVVDTSILRQVRDALETSSDSFDRRLIYDNSRTDMAPPPEAPDVAEEVAASLQKSTQKPSIVRRRWLKSNRREQPIQVAEIELLTRNDSDDGHRAAG